MESEPYSPTLLSRILKETKTIALVGASADWRKASYIVMKYMLSKGYEVIPVNPREVGNEILGCTVFATLADIQSPIDMVDIFRNSNAAGPITDEAITVGAKTIWMQIGVINNEAAQRARQAGLTVIMDRCPKVEYSRLSGEGGWMGLPSNIITSKRTRRV
ncbi:MAG: CoA-binding protein [Parvibaculaceae bacterium]|nr:CoA-binding protein [Parvibaculaceae bacterium]